MSYNINNMRKNAVLTVIAAMLASVCHANVDFKKADDLFNKTDNPTECLTYLESVLPEAAKGKEKAEVLCRMAKACIMIGQKETSKEKKREIFGKGISYAEQAIAEDPKNPEGYMWHSGNVGRECQTRSFAEQAKKLSVIMGDLTTILDKMGKTNYSAAWQAMAEIYYNHPMKSNDDAINFTRKAIADIPENEIRISTYTLLAKLLYERDWNETKRAAAIGKSESKFKGSFSSVTDKYAYYEGSLGTSYIPAWSKKSLGTMTDREEAKAIVAYVRSIYNNANSRTPYDTADMNGLTSISKNW